MSKISQISFFALASLSFFQLGYAQTISNQNTRYQGYSQPMQSTGSSYGTYSGTPGPVGYSPYGQSVYSYPSYSSQTYTTPYSSTYTSPYASPGAGYAQPSYGSSAYNPTTAPYPTYNTQPLQPSPRTNIEIPRLLSSNHSDFNNLIAFEEPTNYEHRRGGTTGDYRKRAQVGASNLEVHTSVVPLDSDYHPQQGPNYQHYDSQEFAHPTRSQNWQYSQEYPTGDAYEQQSKMQGDYPHPTRSENLYR